MANTAPSGSDVRVTVPRSYALRTSNFGFADADGNLLRAVIIDRLPGMGTLFLDRNGQRSGGLSPVAAGEMIDVADIVAGRLTYLAPAGASGAGLASLSFRVRDDGGTAGGGVDTSQATKTLTFDVVASNAVNRTFGSVINLAGLGAADGFRIQGAAADDYAGFSVSSAGDVNGDGFADILVGAYGNDATGYRAGAAYVILGRAGGFGTVDLANLSPAVGFRIESEAAYDRAGRSVSAAGDVNGDGFADLLIGAFQNYGGGSYAGAAYVIFGRAGGFGSVNLADLAPADGFRIQGAAAGDRAGRSVSSAGDVNGDGFADILVGADGNNAGGNTAGAAYVIFGRAGGFEPVDLANLLPTDGFRIRGAAPFDRTGYSVSSAGDVNGDGFADIIVGAYLNDAAGSNAGAAYVIFGRAGGFGSIDLANLAPKDGFRIRGAAADDRAGRSVSSAGDVNGDGFADILVGSYGNDAGGNNAGVAYVIFGRADGFGPVDLANLAPTEGFRIRGAAAFDYAGISVSSAGDVNGDGFADILVGANGNDADDINVGAAYVIFGRSGGFGPIDLANLATRDGFRIQGEAGSDLAGRSVSSAGDVNGDGFADIIVGAYLNDAGGNRAGAAYVIFGRANLSAPTAVADTIATAEDNVAQGNLLANDLVQPGGAAPSVAAVNGRAAAVGQAITLASGALLTVQADGRYRYDPNGRFDDLISPERARATGATNSAAADSFTYTLDGGSTATVAVTITGVDGAADVLRGSAGDNIITVTAAANLIDLSQGGDDTANGGSGNDAVFFGRALTAADRVDGGGGTDLVAIQGNYDLVLGAGNLVNVETLSFVSGADTRFGDTAGSRYRYAVTTVDANVATGQRLTVNGAALLADEDMVFDGSAETDGSFLIYGGMGVDTLTGGANADTFFMADGRFTAGDRIDGGSGNDILVLRGDYAGLNALTFAADTLTGVETISLLSAADTRFFGGGTRYAYDVTADDGNVAAGATMTINGGRLQASETMRFDGRAETDGNSRIFAGAADDILFGGAGNDLIFGGLGRDTMTGGGGNDVFRFDTIADSASDAPDMILDFSLGDIIDLRRIDADAGTPGNDAFSFIGSGAFGGVAGQLRAQETSTGRWFVEADVDGDGVADMGIDLMVQGGHQITVTDFFL